MTAPCLVAWVAIASAFAQAPVASIAGVVLNQVTGEPVRKATVTLSDTKNSFATSPTDGHGHFAFANLPAGEYRINVNRDGFAYTVYGARTPGRPGKIISLAPGESKGDLSIPILPTGVVSGVVRDEEGDPLPFVSVGLLRSVYRRGKPHYAMLNQVATDERGEYRLFNIMPGRYRLVAMPQGGMPFGGGPATGGYTIQFFPGTDQITAAEPVVVGPGKEVAGIDFQLPLRSTVRLHCKLQIPPEVPAGAAWNMQITQGLPVNNNFRNNPAGQTPNDTLEIPYLLPGKYIISTTLKSTGKQYRGVQTIELGGNPLEDVAISFLPAIDIPGSVAVEGPGAEKLQSFRVQLVPGDGVPGNALLGANAKGDLHFTFSDVPPGVWDIGVDPIPAGGYLKAMYLGDQDVLTEDMVIGPKSTGPLKIIVSTQGARIEGEVESDKLKDGSRATVLLAPVGKYSHVLSFYERALTDAQGHFKMQGLRPGTFKLYAFEDIDPDVFQEPVLLKPFENAGVAVELHEGQTASQKLQLIPAQPANEKRP